MVNDYKYGSARLNNSLSRVQLGKLLIVDVPLFDNHIFMCICPRLMLKVNLLPPLNDNDRQGFIRCCKLNWISHRVVSRISCHAFLPPGH